VPEALSLKLKQTETAAYHSPPSSVVVKRASSYSSTPSYIFVAHRHKRFSRGTAVTALSALRCVWTSSATPGAQWVCSRHGRMILKIGMSWKVTPC